MKKYAVLIFLMIAGCSPEIMIRSDYDKDVNLQQYSTYKWAGIRELESRNNPLYYNELNDKRIREAVDNELTSRGYIQADDAELILHYHIVVEDQHMIINEPYGTYGPYWTRQQAVIQYKEGSIIIDIMEASTNSLAWRGWATSVINGTPDINEKLIRNSIVKLFRKYPYSPAGKKSDEPSNPFQ